MALYLSLVIGAEFVAVDGHLSDKIDALGVVWGTAIGLTLAHVFAFNLANLVFARTTPADPRREAIVYQVLAAAIVAGALSIPILVLQLSGALTVDRFILAGFVGVTGWHVSRSAGASDVHALAAGLLMMALGLIVIGVKAALSSH